jgi:hypothetical protein
MRSVAPVWRREYATSASATAPLQGQGEPCPYEIGANMRMGAFVRCWERESVYTRRRIFGG